MTEQETMSQPLAEADPEIAELIQKETERQNSRLELIASENFTSEAVLEAAGSVFTNKYAEGYPGKRYYGGCEWTDQVENLARDRAKSGRYRARHESFAWRASDARASPEFFREDIQNCALRRAPRR